MTKDTRKRIITAGLLVVIAGAAAWFWFGRGEQVAQAQPLVATVRMGDIENTIAATGSLKPRETVEVGAQVSGQLQVLHVEAGDFVEEGQLLAEIDATQQRSRVESSRASLEGQRAQLASRESALRLAEANAERQRRLMEADATSQQDYDDAMDRVESARASLTQLEKQIEQSEADLAIDERELEFTQVRAPIAGTVTSIAMTEGRTLNSSQQAPTILTIADLTLMEVEAQISEADVSDLEPGMEVYFTTLGGGNRRWYSELRQILPQPTIDNNVVLYTGVFEVTNEDRSLLPEMTAQVYFVTSAARDVLTVPIGALTFVDDAGPASAGEGFSGAMAARGGNAGGAATGSGNRNRAAPAGAGGRSGNRLATVQVVGEDGTYSEQEVMIGLTSRVSAEVVSGLEAGDEVVAGILEAGNQGEEDGRGGRPGFFF